MLFWFHEFLMSLLQWSPPQIFSPSNVTISFIQSYQPREVNGNLLQYPCWKIPWTDEPGGLQSTGLERVRHNNWQCTHSRKERVCGLGRAGKHEDADAVRTKTWELHNLRCWISKGGTLHSRVLSHESPNMLPAWSLTLRQEIERMFSRGSDQYSLGVWTTSDPKLMAHLAPSILTPTVSHQG